MRHLGGCSDSFVRSRQSAELGENGVGGFGPDEGFRRVDVLPEVPLDGVLEVGNGLERAAPDAASGDDREEAFDSVEPGGRGRREVEDPARMIGESGEDTGMLVGGTIVGDGIEDLPGRNGALHGIEEFDEVLMAVPRHAAPDHGALEDVEGGEQRGGAVTLIIVSHGSTLAGLERQTRLGPVEGLDLALLADRHDHGAPGRVHVQAYGILAFLSAGGIVRLLERADAMVLQLAEYRIRNRRLFASGHGRSPSFPLCPATHEIPDSPPQAAD